MGNEVPDSLKRTLAGMHILVTRPQPQAQVLAQRLEEGGARVTCLPAIVIEDVPDAEPAFQIIDQLSEFYAAVFVSINAVERGVAMVRQRGGWPPAVHCAAVGDATARTLETLGITVDIRPTERFDSEGLLATIALSAANVRGQRIATFRGQGGRDVLATGLHERGARPEYVEVYRRALPQGDVCEGDVSGVTAQMKAGALDAVVVTSVEALDNLFMLLGSEGRKALFEMTLLVPSQRIAEAARDKGVKRPPMIAANATDSALVEKLRLWRSETA